MTRQFRSFSRTSTTNILSALVLDPWASLADITECCIPDGINEQTCRALSTKVQLPLSGCGTRGYRLFSTFSLDSFAASCCSHRRVLLFQRINFFACEWRAEHMNGRVCRRALKNLLVAEIKHASQVLSFGDDLSESFAVFRLPELMGHDVAEQAVGGEQFQAAFDEDDVDVVVAFGGRFVAPLVERRIRRAPTCSVLARGCRADCR